jgi:hypothetical protein
MSSGAVVVGGVVPARGFKCNIRDEVWSYALDQRAFGPGQLVVAFGDRRGTFRAMAHCRRTEPFTAGLTACILHLGRGTEAAVVLNDERVEAGPPDLEALAARFALARSVCAATGIHLVDWIGCDDQLFRSTRLAIDPESDWWDVPRGGRR